MSAAAERARLAAIGDDLAVLADNPGRRRGQALLGRAREAPAVGFADLTRAPGWLRRPRAALVATAKAVALIAMAPEVSTSIDGAWLGELARAAGEPALDRAIAVAAQTPDGGLPAVHAAALDGLGFDVMRAALSAPLVRYLAWAPSAGIAVDARLAAFCLDMVAA